jgi:hypothetical protein
MAAAGGGDRERRRRAETNKLAATPKVNPPRGRGAGRKS